MTFTTNTIWRIFIRCTQLILLAIPVLLLVAPVVVADEYAIITNKNNPVQTITALDAKRIFLGKKTSWQDDNQIVIIINHNPQILNSFIRGTVNKSHTQFTIYWKKQLFSGRGVLPKSFKTDKEVLDFVAAHENAIGYIAASSMDDSIKKVTIQ